MDWVGIQYGREQRVPTGDPTQPGGRDGKLSAEMFRHLRTLLLSLACNLTKKDISSQNWIQVLTDGEPQDQNWEGASTTRNVKEVGNQ